MLNGVTFVVFGAVLLGSALGATDLVDRVLRSPEPDGRPHAPGRDRDAGFARQASDGVFLGWFGPRGLASIVFGVMVVQESNLPHEHLIVLAIYLTVGLSVFAHGLTAAPLAARYARWYEQHPRDKAPPMESAPTDVTRPPPT